MYKIQPINKKTLIVLDEVVAATPIDNDVPVKHLQTSIQIAEARIKAEMCTDLYNDLREKKNKVVTIINQSYIQSLFPSDAVIEVGDIANAIEFVDDEWYVELWYEHLWKLLAEMTVYVASPMNFSRFTSQGEMHNNPRQIMNEGSGSATVELETMKWKMDKWNQDRISPLIASMNEYLYINRGYFPKVNCKDWYNSREPNGVSIQRKTAWITNIYKDKNTDECYTCQDRD